MKQTGQWRPEHQTHQTRYVNSYLGEKVVLLDQEARPRLLPSNDELGRVTKKVLAISLIRTYNLKKTSSRSHSRQPFFAAHRLSDAISLTRRRGPRGVSVWAKSAECLRDRISVAA